MMVDSPMATGDTSASLLPDFFPGLEADIFAYETHRCYTISDNSGHSMRCYAGRCEHP